MKTNKPIKKLVEDLSRKFCKETFLQRKPTNDQKAHEKMFNITDYQRNENQSYNGVSHISQNGHHQKIYK